MKLSKNLCGVCKGALYYDDNNCLHCQTLYCVQYKLCLCTIYGNEHIIK